MHGEQYIKNSTGYISSGHLSAGSLGELKDMVALIQDSMVVLVEHQRPDTGSSGSPVVVHRRINPVHRLLELLYVLALWKVRTCSKEL
jgi:hypothetical protein